MNYAIDQLNQISIFHLQHKDVLDVSVTLVTQQPIYNMNLNFYYPLMAFYR